MFRKTIIPIEREPGLAGQKNSPLKAIEKKELTTDRVGVFHVPQGNTTRGVNAYIVKYLLAHARSRGWKRLLDIPCGNGLFAQTVKMHVGMDVLGADILLDPKYLSEKFYQRIDAASPCIDQGKHPNFDVVTCISGIMEFGNTSRFLDFCHENLADGGGLIVSNDSVQTLQDRIMFFFLGRTRRQKLLRLQGENIWNLFPMGMMIRLLQDSGFKVEGIEYFIGKRRNYWMLLPSIFLYPFQLAYIVFSGFAEKYNLKGDLKFKMYPFRSMYCTHYVVVCRKSSDI